jgi:hypothetical protein
LDYESAVNEWLKEYRMRAQQKKKLEEQTRQLPPAAIQSSRLSAKPAGPTMSERAAVHRDVASSPRRPRKAPLPSLHRQMGFFHVVVGSVLVVWGIAHPERFLLVLLLGIGVAGFGSALLAGFANRQPPTTATANSEESK